MAEITIVPQRTKDNPHYQQALSQNNLALSTVIAMTDILTDIQTALSANVNEN